MQLHLTVLDDVPSLYWEALGLSGGMDQDILAVWSEPSLYLPLSHIPLESATET